MKELFKSIIIKTLTCEARLLLRRHKPKVVAITGSLGKTGTKDVVAAALSAKYTVRKSPKSFNSEFGVPLTILGLSNAWNNPIKWIKNVIKGLMIAMFSKGYEDVLVLEIGADKPGDIATLTNWLIADIVIVTAVPDVPVHVEFYPTVEAVLIEKGELINTLKNGGLLITGPDEQVAALSDSNGDTIRVSCDEADIVYEGGRPIGVEFKIGKSLIRSIGVLGKHQGLAVAFALRTAEALGVDVRDAINGVEQIPKTPGRMRLLEGQNGSTIIDDSYNSSPAALQAALETLGGLEIRGRKIAVLGDMLELGEHTSREHRRAGIQAAHIVDELYTIGPEAKKLGEAAINEGLSEVKVHSYDTDKATQVGKLLANKVQDADVILVKSSQGNIRLEKTVKELMCDSEQAGELLVRQEVEWLRR
ncbi:MAG: UDP-N-acetylmuramoyl-tripeptide--D-alanyl-D-alanine ligase [Candidatus Pacebacteria bacterium]|nr:UDP-N-acetylmuramoyl-tripeptide--D-alanyl-D-alanine ligase [Candidatus Paceibacterota bacterium]